MPLKHSQIVAINVTEKFGSVVSLLGAAFVIVTFLCSSKFRKPINRLVFYASWGNVLSNVATIIGTSAISHGIDAPLCQFQAFLIQWFLLVDALWAFCMACNVYLTFFHHYEATQLRRLEWKYIVACYGLPSIPAIIYLFVNTADRGKVYGPAILWCWISIKWDFLRVATFYGVAWIVIVLAMGIYIRVGIYIFKLRRPSDPIPSYSSSEGDGRRNTTDTPIHRIRKTEEVIVMTELATEPQHDRPSHHYRAEAVSFFGSPRHSTRTPLGRPVSSVNPGVILDPAAQYNKAAIKYCKCAVLFFLVLIITWVPSTFNRIYTLVHPRETLFGSAYAASLVLPLQGFWNFVVYVTTSQWACKSVWQTVKTTLFYRHAASGSATAVDAEKGRGSSQSSEFLTRNLDRMRGYNSQP